MPRPSMRQFRDRRASEIPCGSIACSSSRGNNNPPPMTVLVVDDDPNVLAFIDRMLTQSGHTVLAAEDPDHARFVLAEHGGKADLLLVDIVLPGSNGLDFARAAKAENPSL